MSVEQNAVMKEEQTRAAKAHAKQTTAAVPFTKKTATLVGAAVRDYATQAERIHAGIKQQEESAGSLRSALVLRLEKAGVKPEHFDGANTSAGENKALLRAAVAQGIEAAQVASAGDDKDSLLAVRSRWAAFHAGKAAVKDMAKADVEARNKLSAHVGTVTNRIIGDITNKAEEAAKAAMTPKQLKAAEAAEKRAKAKKDKERAFKAAKGLTVYELAAVLGSAIAEDTKPKYAHGDAVAAIKELFEVLGLKYTAPDDAAVSDDDSDSDSE